MNPAEVLRRLWKEQHEWEKADTQTIEVKWVLHGIKLCIGHIHDIVKEQRQNERLKHPKIDHRHATHLFHACRGAYNQLQLSCRKAAMKILSSAMDKVPTGFHGKAA